MKLLVLKVAEPPEIVENVPADETFGRSKGIISGHIEPVATTIFLDTDATPQDASLVVRRTAWVNEDGRILRLPGNSLASHLAGQSIVGTMVVVLRDTDYPDMKYLNGFKQKRGQTLAE